ncbi:hypothetical protein [Roseicyclus sp.]|uniref:hypothetical protein n=1 Tax=Roseicyclus sp. TaxID=1914329 RepID=UPI001BCE0CEC|nr:hypothetical protein [Roseicyclus sp.]
MLFSNAVDMVIGLILIYLLLSVICTSINELIAGLLRLRARVLHAEIRLMIDDDKVLEAFWNTGLMRSLSRPTPQALVAPGQAPSYMGRTNFSHALIEALRTPVNDQVGGDSTEEMAPLFARVDRNSILYKVIHELGLDPLERVDAARQGLESWFDQVMERATGVYKRYLSMVSFLVALILVVAINADTLAIANTLWRDEALRARFVEAAAGIVDTSSAQPAATPDREQLAELTGALLPSVLGWSNDSCARDGCLEVLGFAVKALGLLLTAFAITLGAPLWFDVLTRFAALRNSGPLRRRDPS